MVTSCASVSVHGDKICARSERGVCKISLGGNYFLHAMQNNLCVCVCAYEHVFISTTYHHMVKDILQF